MLGQGVRLAWTDVPVPVRDAIASLAGGPVAGVQPCAGGFSPGAAVRLTLENGDRAFAKTVSSEQNPRSPDLYRREAVVYDWLPAHPAVPALRGTYDDGTWVALVFDCVPADPPVLPWAPGDLDVVLRTVRDVQAAAGAVDGAAVPVTSMLAEDFGCWRAMASAPPDGLDAWSLANVHRCAEIEAGWTALAEGSALLHTDLRADNVLLADGRAWLVDWAWACTGAAWVEAVLMATSVALTGGPSPEALVAAAYPDAPADGVTAVVTALAGFFTAMALAPPPPGLPTLRAHQAKCGRVARAWLARLLGE